MTSCRTLTMALGVIGAVALSAPSEARSGRNAAIGFGVAAGALALGAAAASASQPHYYYDGYEAGPYAYAGPYTYRHGYHGYSPRYGAGQDSYAPYGAPGWSGPAPRYGAD